MNPILTPNSFSPFSNGPFASSRSYAAEQTKAGTLSQTLDTDLTITTAEGDTVTINLSSALNLEAGTYSRQCVENGQRTSTQTAYRAYSDSQDVAITVEGDLNAEELADIREAMADIGSMIEDFLAGDLQEMARDGELFKALDTISGIDAAFTYEQQATYGKTEKVSLSTQAQEGRNHRYRSAHGRLHQLMNRIDHLTDEMAKRIDGFGGRRQQMTDSVSALLNRYAGGEVAGAPTDDLSRSAVHTVQSVFLQKMETRIESGEFTFSYSA